MLEHVVTTVLDGQQEMCAEAIIETNARTSSFQDLQWCASQSGSHERW